jgi:hypothetical protein
MAPDEEQAIRGQEPIEDLDRSLGVKRSARTDDQVGISLLKGCSRSELRARKPGEGRTGQGPVEERSTAARLGTIAIEE